MTSIDDIIDDLPEEQLMTIDIDEIGAAASKSAKDMVENLSRFYYDDEFMNAHPQLRNRINDELETLRILIKMRAADEEAHDSLVKAISGNNNNASLYLALARIQSSILSVTTKIGEIVDRLNNLMKGYQLEIQFDNGEGVGDVSNDSSIHRGSKEFIKAMICEG